MPSHNVKIRMGNSNSNSNPTNVTDAEIERLRQRFRHLDRDNSSTITIQEWHSIPELAMNPLSTRLFEVLDEDLDDEINFEQFVELLSVFSERAKREKKLRFAFRVYDIDDDGFISHEELYRIVRLLVGSSISHDQILQIVDKTLLDYDVIDKDGRISYEEFKRSMFDKNIEGILTIRI